MWTERQIDRAELERYAEPADRNGLAASASALLRQQTRTWPRLRLAMGQFGSIMQRTLHPGDLPVTLQHNPGRMESVSAKVDKTSIEERRCFLCAENSSPEQYGILWQDRYVLLANPGPIFQEHLTLVHVEHRPQAIEASLDDFLALAKDLSPKFNLFYNGPRCGASAPDHLHFQACNRGVLPLESQLDGIKWIRVGKPHVDRKSLRYGQADPAQPAEGEEIIAGPLISSGKASANVGIWTDSVRSAVVVISDRADIAAQALRDVLRVLPNDGDAEPAVNLAAWYTPRSWIVALIPRKAHRPACYFAEGDERILVSPGAVDMAGLVVAPVREDYDRLDDARLANIFREVSYPPEELRSLLSEL